ncbi:MAG: prolipoprotein diacylglyceryl transferase [Gemmatimonadetes bacterium]|jgi:phosphatidylglycerol:prolipoprotein diacylglycerol transferase|nr:prolipoprotein diacylglyceryl transferase [Gemmatimonadota bacterium]MBK7716629.1 prolipoprotein diacylglyceryl transferase [Gemmatimonadota bacterium]MBK9692528.1 prolipoprotein diacylglyceryl transferase [Gemmatimonadota bacterium]MBP9201698.1 prolipoprotein diacylglyceryl transferase [Gemmatimonadales bacterium]
MNIYPFIVKLGPVELTGYGIMMMVGFLVGGWLIALELRRRGLYEEYASDITVAAVVGGIVGAKLWYWVLNGGSLFSRGGLVWYGGFVGGFLAVMLNGWRLKVPIRWTFHLCAPALAAAYALGRIGCFIVNDDYGRPTDLPWGVRFPQGLPPSTAQNLQEQFGLTLPPGTDPAAVLAVHPTQLYEAILMLAAFTVLWRLRLQARPVGWIFGVYLVCAGIERFIIEIFRAKDDRLFGPLTIAQLVSIVLCVGGALILGTFRKDDDLAPGPYLRQTPS